MPFGATLGQAGEGFYTLYNALGGGGANGANMAQASGAQRSAAANAAGLSGRMSNGMDYKLQNAQLHALNSQTKMRMQLFQSMMGGGGGKGGFNMGGGGGIADLMAQLQNYGSGRAASINQSFGNAQGTALARLQASGIGNSNLTGGVMGNMARNKELALSNLGDDILSQKIGVQERGMERDMRLQALLAQLVG